MINRKNKTMSGFSLDQITGQLPEALSVGSGAYAALMFKDLVPGSLPDWAIAAGGVAIACQLYRHFALGEDWFTYGGGYKTPAAMLGAVAGVFYPVVSSPEVSAAAFAAVGDIAGKYYEDNFAS